jgi:hypothetical protein
MTNSNRRRIVLRIWELRDAPASLRRLVSTAKANGWLAVVSPGEDNDEVREWVNQWCSEGHSIERYESEDGRLILVGPHHSR